MNQVCFYVIGSDTTVTMASEAGQLQLNVMEPVIAYSMFTSLEYLINGCYTLREKCIDGITANKEECENSVMNSIGIVTSLSPILGYEKTSEIAKEALKHGKTIYQIVVEEQQLINDEKWNEIYSLHNMINPRLIL